MNFENEYITISFSDLTFTITDEKTIQETKLKNPSDQIKTEHLEVLRQYLNSWIRSETI